MATMMMLLSRRFSTAGTSWSSRRALAVAGGSALPTTNVSFLSTNTKKKKTKDPKTAKTVAEQQQPHDLQSKWRSYLSSGRGSEALFACIAAAANDEEGGKLQQEKDKVIITPQSVHAFLEGVGALAKGKSGGAVHPRAFDKLEAMAQDHPMTLREFQSWLIGATKFAPGEPNSSLQRDYRSHPNTGGLVVEKAKAEAGDRKQETIVEPRWNASTMNQAVRRMQYAVRGSVVMLAEKLQSEGRDILYTNIGNPQGVGQQPLTYFRQVLALTDLPSECGVDDAAVASMFPQDVVARARDVRKSMGGAGTGAYTGSQGVLDFRERVADYIEKRDGHTAYPGNIFLTNGASSAIDLVLTTLIASDHDAVMIPIPQYPIYSALIARLAGRQVGYMLHEADGWSVSVEELEKRLTEAHGDDNGMTVKALVLINPGNPTGQVLSRKDLESLCRFCAKHQIVLLADEVYQRNVYATDKEFVSTKKVALETPGCENLQLVSFHSTSKGLIGECGRRGGYMELHNIDPFVQSQLYKLASSGLCSNVPGQVLTSLMVSPPEPGDASYDLFTEEESGIYDGLAYRAGALVDGLNSIDGISCQPAEGAMYAFPRVEVPDDAVTEASKQEVTPDTLYALSLLNETGICVVPASGFGQEEGRYGFRTTFLPPEERLLAAVDRLADHHKLFCDKYS